MPFDLVEAESELIDGLTTEFEGFAFSLVYAAEVVTGFLVLKMFSMYSGFSISSIFLLVSAMFVGRIFLTRLLISDCLELILSTGLILTVFCLTVQAKKLNFLKLERLIFNFRLG